MSRLLLTVLFTMLTVSAEAQESIGNSPLRTWGEFSSAYRYYESDSDKAYASNWLNQVSINASSYIWQPWFALVDGSLSLAVDQTKNEDEPRTSDDFTSGSISFSLFPPSRFPFTMYAKRSRSQFDEIDFTRQRTTDEYGFTQNYRTLSGNHQYRLSFRDNESGGTGEITTVNSKVLNLGTVHSLGKQSVSTDIQANDVSNLDQETRNYSLSARHRNSNNSDFSVNNLLSTTRTESDFGQSFSNVTTSQYSGLIGWRPRHRKDISMTGSLRLSDVEIEQSLVDSAEPESRIENASLNINQGLVYRHSDALSFTQTINLNQAQLSDNSSLYTASETAGLTYSPERLQLAIGDYGWTTTSVFSNRHGDVASSQSLSASLSHSLVNDIYKTANGNLRSNISQGVSRSLDSEDTKETGLDHTFSISWNSSGLNRQNLVRFQASDSRDLEEEDTIQLFTFQYSGDLTINRYSRLSGNLTLQRSQQSTDQSTSKNTVANGQIDYNRNRAFNIPRMNFRSQLRLNRQLSESERLEQQIRDESPTDLLWENAILYRIGRLQTELSLDVSKQDAQYDYLFKFEITRSFGDR